MTDQLTAFLKSQVSKKKMQFLSSEPSTSTHSTDAPKLWHPDVPGEGGTPIDAHPGGGEAWGGQHDGAGVAAQDGAAKGGRGAGQGRCLALLLLLLLLLQL